MQKIKIKSAFMTQFGKLDEDFSRLILRAAEKAFLDNDPGDFSDVYLSSFASGVLCGIVNPLDFVSNKLRQEYPELKARFHGPYKTGGEALYNYLESSKKCQGSILILGCEKMTHMSAGSSSGLLSRTINPHDTSYGATLPSLGALVSRRYMEHYSIPMRTFDFVAVKNHYNGSLNPRAHFQKEIKIEDVSSSPMVSDPLRRLHCAPVSDGAVSVVLDQQSGGISIAGWGMGEDAPLFHDRREIDRFIATAHAAQTALRNAGLGTKDLDVVEIHDAFSPFELINLEEMGFFPRGRAWCDLANGELNINGRLAVNTSGGLKARGHPIGACGLSSIVEVFEQLKGIAGARQHRGANKGIIQSAGGVSRKSYVFILAN